MTNARVEVTGGEGGGTEGTVGGGEEGRGAAGAEKGGDAVVKQGVGEARAGEDHWGTGKLDPIEDRVQVHGCLVQNGVGLGLAV